MNSPLVSLLTPCFNAAPFIHRLLDSVLEQTWPNLEMIVVDDGSTDGSSDVLRAYEPRFRSRGYGFRIVRQENGGQSNAINKGLKMVRGEFLAWPDADDWYASREAIERLVQALEESPPEVGLVYSRFTYIGERMLRPIRLDPRQPFRNARLFEDCVFRTNDFQFAAGSFLVRFQALRETTGLEIWTDRDAGQNWQLLLPLLYRYNASFVDEPLYNILVRERSHSRGQYSESFERENLKRRIHEKTILATIARIRDMDAGERADLERRVRAEYDRICLDVALRWRRRDEIRRIANRLGASEMRIGQRMQVRLSAIPGSYRAIRALHGAAVSAAGRFRAESRSCASPCTIRHALSRNAPRSTLFPPENSRVSRGVVGLRKDVLQWGSLGFQLFCPPRWLRGLVLRRRAARPL